MSDNTIDGELLNLKSEIFNALEVFELEESSRTPDGTQFWMDCEKAIKKYAAQEANKAVVAELEKLKQYIDDYPPYEPIGTTRQFCEKLFNDRIAELLKALTEDKEPK